MLFRSDTLPPVKQQLKIAFQNVPFFMLIASYALQSTGIGVLMAGLIYYVKHVMNMQIGRASCRERV